MRILLNTCLTKGKSTKQLHEPGIGSIRALVAQRSARE
jgi:hypothetical protein